MDNLWFLIIGVIFGLICSIYAKRKNMHAENWFTLGLFFWGFAVLALYLAIEKNSSSTVNIEVQEEEEFSFPY